MGHLCLASQNVHVLDGTRRVQGRGGAGTGCWRMALALQDAGAFAEVLEAIPADLGTRGV
jgi:3-methyl-2-oxobutanoate hydroxymethyltransferase